MSDQNDVQQLKELVATLETKAQRATLTPEELQELRRARERLELLVQEMNKVALDKAYTDFYSIVEPPVW